MKQPRSWKFTFKKWAVAMLLASLASAGMVNAAGLGKLNVLSRLGQPFAAEIDLLNVTKDDLASLKVSLAPTAAYQASNLRFDPALNTLRLSVEQRANGTHYIRATSVQRVTEPYLDLLIDVTAQNNTLQRAYSALLDLPETAKPVAAAPAPLAAAPASTADAVAARAPSPPRARPQPPAPDVTQAVVAAPVMPTTRTPVAAETLKTEKEEKAELPTPEPTAPSSEPALQPQVPAPAPPKAIALPETPPPPQPGIIDKAKEHAALIGGAVLALLAGIGGLWALRRRKAAPGEASRPIASTVSTATAAIDATPNVVTAPETTVANVTDFVDPIDEAKVYLEHGRDEPAEKILRAALSEQPGREDIQMLLLEILAARGDKDGFNQLAGRLHKQTSGLGEHWKRAMAMGYAVDPGYPLYSPTAAGVAPVARDAQNPALVDIDLGIAAPTPVDMSDTAFIQLDDGNASTDMEKTAVASVDVELFAGAQPLPDMNFEFPEKAPAAPVVSDAPGLDFEIDFSAIPAKPDAPAPATMAAPVAHDLLDEPVQHKLDLARAYREMGDKEAALELLREVEHVGDAATGRGAGNNSNAGVIACLRFDATHKEWTLR